MKINMCVVLLMALVAKVFCDLATGGLKYKPYEDYKSKYGKKYSKQSEQDYRLAIFLKKSAKIEAHNKEKKAWIEQVNMFTDITDEEFAATYLNLRIPTIQKAADVSSLQATIYAATSIDWSSNGKVTPVRYQGGCGSCWAFSAVAAIESAYLVSKNAYYDLSEQQLVDCSYLNFGCNGGWPLTAFAYIKSYGINYESVYPYVAKGQSCKKSSGPIKIASYGWTGSSCNSLITALTLKPVSVCVDATNWGPYKSGIFSNCKSSINHAVLLVGYTGAYWKIKNSWATSWGESGFMRLAAPASTCGICNIYSSYASV